MANLKTLRTHIQNLIAKDDFATAIQELCALLKNSPHLDEAILQSARHKDITRQIRLGVVDFESANVTKNQIRVAVLALLDEIEDLSQNQPNIKEEVENYITINGNQNIVVQNSNHTNITVNNYIVREDNYIKRLPKDLIENLIGQAWIESLKQALHKQKVSVSNDPNGVFEHYGWLIESSLQKIMGADLEDKMDLEAFSFMTETYQSSLRYLCFIQVVQLLQKYPLKQHPLLIDFINLNPDTHLSFDYLNLLIVCTEMLPKNDAFVEGIYDFVQKLSDKTSDLYEVTLFLDKMRSELYTAKLVTDDKLVQLMDEYRTALVYWLQEVAFLAKYRLVSIKDINIYYRLGTAKNFVHAYGELHGIYKSTLQVEDYKSYSLEDVFTYNHSILLFKGTEIATCLEKMYQEKNYISLSPLLIDRSVFSEKEKQTPEIYYYTGRTPSQYHFEYYKNVLPLNKEIPLSNKDLIVKRVNINQPKLNELFENLKQVIQPYTKPKP